MKTATLRVTLTPQLHKFVEGKVRTGRYRDASEVIRDALRVFERGADAGEDPSLEVLIQEGLSSGPAEPLTRRAWDRIWTESDKLARTLGSKRKHVPRRAAA